MQLYQCDNCHKTSIDFAFHVVVIYKDGLRRDMHYDNLQCKHRGLQFIRSMYAKGLIASYHINERIGDKHDVTE